MFVESTEKKPLNFSFPMNAWKEEELVDLNQVRHHNEFNTEENKSVRDRLSVFTVARIKVLEHIQLLKLTTCKSVLC